MKVHVGYASGGYGYYPRYYPSYTYYPVVYQPAYYCSPTYYCPPPVYYGGYGGYRGSFYGAPVYHPSANYRTPYYSGPVYRNTRVYFRDDYYR